MRNKLKPTKRGLAAIAAIVSVAVGGYVTMPSGSKVHDDVALASTYLVEPWEGEVLKAYLDRLARPPVWTICAGDTNDVKPGMIETPKGCEKRLQVKLETVYRPALVKCVVRFNDQPLAWRSMMNSLAWNIGTGGACGSTAARIVNDAMRLGKVPDYVASCEAATAFNKAGGRIYIGLVKRREMGDATRIGEGELCRSGV
ncbi:lysozyme [Rhizobium lentis]|uniref:Lysozyme n=1 Tax=Rhizobium lentis TaxID=1138194 RepID=A0A7W8UMK9_9HYPH|nr:lysozyme [Rhizobium lentis]MBB4574377.1 GH24 family phage-related lysozyme (muramidase) [Rhizobium lentis]MBB5550303.1 GH24 family phage-related lysozyme (muramidase) [Rhizobium lentis]MBB5560668.1 GH24 family phage-related lysozyme (muramidase) [Rhizobium lentis]MBB5567253.1 GH24 family phage-related lysozyme (muramidase) [Rhizobium lentis]